MERFTQLTASRWQSKYSQILLDDKGFYWWFTTSKAGEVVHAKVGTYDQAKFQCDKARNS